MQRPIVGKLTSGELVLLVELLARGPGRAGLGACSGRTDGPWGPGGTVSWRRYPCLLYILSLSWTTYVVK